MNPKRLPKWIQKSIKIDSWTPMCPLGVPLDPWITKVVPRVPKMEPQVSKMTVSIIKSNPVLQSTSHQFPASKGAGGRGEAFKSAAPLAEVAGRAKH